LSLRSLEDEGPDSVSGFLDDQLPNMPLWQNSSTRDVNGTTNSSLVNKSHS